MSIIREIFEAFQYPVWIKNKKNNMVFVNETFKASFNKNDYDVDKLFDKIENINHKSTDIIKINNKIYKHITFNNDKYEKIVGILVDFSDIIESESQIYEKHILRTVIDSIPDLTFYKDKKLKYLGINKECEKFYNDMGVTDIVGKNDLEFPLDLSFTTQCYEHDQIVISKKKPLHIEETVDERTFETIKTPIIDEFVILLPELSDVECTNMMKKINDLCENTVCGKIKISISMGYSILNEGDNIDKVLVEAEDKVYKKKMLSDRSVRASMLETLKKNLANKNVETEKHTERVADFCMEIAKELNLDDDMIEKVSLIGRLHDIGKIGISEHILLKPGKLTDGEYEIMKTHSEKGYRLASLLPEVSCISREILAHHERWDGLGYPLGLRKDEIPILARIVSVADSFDAMTNDRCYSKGRSIEEGLEELIRCAGTQFDPEIVHVFTNIIEKSHVKEI